MNDLPIMTFDYETIKLKVCHQATSLGAMPTLAFNSPTIDKVYGELRMPCVPSNRPYLYTSMVTSIDGKIAFSDAPQGPLIARNNFMDQDGALADWWMLNMLRAISDGVIIGAKTMQAEPDYTCHIFDGNLLNDRLNNQQAAIPWHIIVSIDGSDIPFDHIMLQHPAIPVMIATSAKGLETVKASLNLDYQLVDLNLPETQPERTQTNKKPIMVVISGQAMPDSRKLMQFLVKQGLKRVLVESPTYMHHLIGLEMMDEIFMSYSCVYLGGNALSLGKNGQEFSSVNHPHTKLLEIRSHSDHFFYLRHQLVYGIGK